MSDNRMKFPVFGSAQTADQLRHRQDGASHHHHAHRAAGGGLTDAGSILPLAQGRASAAGHGLPALQRVSGNRTQLLIQQRQVFYKVCRRTRKS